MEENTQTEIVKLFTEKIESITKMFEDERKKQQKRLNTTILSFLIFVLMIAYSSGYNMYKLSSLESSQYDVDSKVQMLYMIAVKEGKITLDMMNTEILTRSGNHKKKGS